MKLNYNELANYQRHWKESKHISKERATGLIELSNVFIQKVKANGDETDGVVLLYPEDCSDYEVFMDFASVMAAYVTVRKEGGLQMDGWSLNIKTAVE